MNSDQIDARIRLHAFMQDLRKAYPAAATHPELADRLLMENKDRLSAMTVSEALNELGGLIKQALEKRKSATSKPLRLPSTIRSAPDLVAPSKRCWTPLKTPPRSGTSSRSAEQLARNGIAYTNAH